MNTDLFREDRLAFWDRLIRGEHVPPTECRELVTRLAHDASPEERTACVLLLAAVDIANTGSRARRRDLQAVLRYRFSHTGTKDKPESLDPHELRDAGLEDVTGLYLTWPEAMESVGRRINPEAPDYPALKRIEKLLRAKCVCEWEERFGSTAPGEMSERR